MFQLKNLMFQNQREKDENGNVIDIQKQGYSWNDLVELGAKVS